MELQQSSSGKLYAKQFRVTMIDNKLRQQMYSLFSRYYDSVSPESFIRDLNEKNDVICLFDSGDHSLQGFSTIKLYDREINSRRILVIFSGDTIIDSRYWGQTALQKAFFRYVVKTKTRHVFIPVYWFLISKGYKTYLGLVRNVPDSWPRLGKQMPRLENCILNALARERFGKSWKPELGILRFDECQGKLKQGVAPIDRTLLEQSDIGFFAQKNPGHIHGDELCCLGLINWKTFTYFPLKTTKKILTKTGNRLQALWASS